MSFRKHWPRWIFASTSRHFHDALKAEGIPLYIEGQYRDTREETDFAEFRFYGPRSLLLSKNCWELRIEINILLQSVMNEQNFHNIHRLVGVAAAAFLPALSTYRRGNGPDDDQSFLGCLDLLQRSATRDYLEINHFGIIDKTTHLVQATVEGHYKMLLEELT